MSVFSIHTRISIEIYVKFRVFTSDFSAIYDELPPFLHKGLIVEKNKEPVPWTVSEDTELGDINPALLFRGVDFNADIFTAHEILVSNNIEDKDTYPCLESAPQISEAMASLFSGVTDTQSISFTLMDPNLRRYFSSDFTTTNSLVRIYRVGLHESGDIETGQVVTPVWVGYVTNVTQGNVPTTITARNEMKRLDQKATFGFLDEIPKWRVNDFKIPVISAVMIPYTVSVEQHTPQLVSYYEDWRRDYYLLATGKNVENVSAEGVQRRRELDITFQPFFGMEDYLMSPGRAKQRTILDNLDNVGKSDAVTAFTHVRDIFFIATARGFIYCFNLAGEPYNEAIHNLHQNPFWAMSRLVGINCAFIGGGFYPYDYIRGLSTDGVDLFILVKDTIGGPTLGKGIIQKIPISFFTSSKVSRTGSQITTLDFASKINELGELNEERFGEPDENTIGFPRSTPFDISDIIGNDSKRVYVANYNFTTLNVYPNKDLLHIDRRKFYYELAEHKAMVGWDWDDDDGLDISRVSPNRQVDLSSEIWLSQELASISGSEELGDYRSTDYEFAGLSIFNHPYYSRNRFVTGVWTIHYRTGIRHRNNYLLAGSYTLVDSDRPGRRRNRPGTNLLYAARLTRRYRPDGFSNFYDLVIHNLCTLRTSPERPNYRGVSTLRDNQEFFVSFRRQDVRIGGKPFSMSIILSYDILDRAGLNVDNSYSLVQLYLKNSSDSLYIDWHDYYIQGFSAFAADYPAAMNGPVYWAISFNSRSLVCFTYERLSGTFRDSPYSFREGYNTGFVEHVLFRIKLPSRVTINIKGSDKISVTVRNYKDIDIRDDYIYVTGQYNSGYSSTLGTFMRRYRLPYSVHLESSANSIATFNDTTVIANTTLIGLTAYGVMEFFDLLTFKTTGELKENRRFVRFEDYDDLGRFISIAYRLGYVYILESDGTGPSRWSIRVYTLDGKRRKHLDFSLYDDPNDPFFVGYRNNGPEHVSSIDIAENLLYVARSNGFQDFKTATKYQPYVGVWELPDIEEDSEVNLLSLAAANIFEGLVFLGDYYYLLNSSTNTVMAVDASTQDYSRSDSFVFEVEAGETAFGITGNSDIRRFWIVVNKYIESDNTFTGYVRTYEFDGTRIATKDFSLSTNAQYTGISYYNGNLYALNALTNNVEAWSTNGNRRSSSDISLETLSTGLSYEGVHVDRTRGCLVLVADPSGFNEAVHFYSITSNRGTALTKASLGRTVDARSDLTTEQKVYNGITVVDLGGIPSIATLALGVDQINIDTWGADRRSPLLRHTGSDITINLRDTRDFSGITAGVGLLSEEEEQQTTTVNFYMLDAFDNTLKFYLSRIGNTSNIANLGTGDWTGVTTDDAVSVLRKRIAKDGYVYVLNNSRSSIKRDGLDAVTYENSVHVYSLSGEFLPGRSFGIIDGNWQGITVESLGIDLYILDNRENRVVAYGINGRRNFLKDFDLPSGNWTGITTDGLYLYALDNARNKIFVYSLTGKRRSTFDRQLPSKNWTGITTDNKFLYLINNTDKKIILEAVAENFAFFRGKDGETSAEDAVETGQSILNNYVNNTLKPTYVTFDKSVMPRSFIQMERNGRLTFNRGIFILPSEDDSPTVPGETFDPLALRSENFRLALAPAEALSSQSYDVSEWGFEETRFENFRYTSRYSGTYLDFDGYLDPSNPNARWYALVDGGNKVVYSDYEGGTLNEFSVEGPDNTAILFDSSRVLVLDNSTNKIKVYNDEGVRRSADDVSLGNGDYQNITESFAGAYHVFNKSESRVEPWYQGTHDTSRDVNLKDLPGLSGIDKNDILAMGFHSSGVNALYCLYDIGSAIDALPDSTTANSKRYVVAIYPSDAIDREPYVVSFSNTAFVGLFFYYSVSLRKDYVVGMTASGAFETFEVINEGGDFPRAFYHIRRSYITKTGNLYDGIGEEPFTANIGTSFTRWTVLGVSRGQSRAIDSTDNDLVVNYSDGNDGGVATRPPHPLDPLYISEVNRDIRRLSFIWFNYHNLHKFYRVRRNPTDYFLDFWATYLIHRNPSRDRFPTVGIRSKDMYSTESTFKDFQGINPNRSHALYDYTLDGNITPNPTYDGSASNMLRMMPALRDRHTDGSNDAFHELTYKNSPFKGGAYYVSAIYDQPDVMYYDTSIIENDAAYEGYLRSEYFNGFYHHDMYESHSQHLRPSTFIYACLKNARLEPAFRQDGEDISGNLNDHRMQLIADTDTSYGALVTRVLPSLGYLARMNGETRKVELVDLFQSRRPVFTFNDDMIQLIDVIYDSGQQYSSYIFENNTMLSGDNTLDEFRESSEEQGRQVVFNSNSFVTGKTLELKTGTWTTDYATVSEFLSKRQDRYQITVTNCVLMDSGSLNVPAVGDWVRVDSQLIPGSFKSVDLLIIAKVMSEATTDFTGVYFEL